MMRLIEVIEGDETSAGDGPGGGQLRAADPQAADHAAARRPGFVVNRILNSAVSEIWRVQEEEGIDVKEIDKVVQESKAAPMGPFFLDRPARPRHGAARRRAPAGELRRSLLRPHEA